ncbi:hypothetical protein [Deinococcus navajonensis]|uniref:Uncharacterized protein n=1 Tax=Deinococcus navajonensis TaxID=309884 RepID=A0ABV8XIX1_9DEIO
MNTSSTFHALPGGSTLAVTSARTVACGAQVLPARLEPDQVVRLAPADIGLPGDPQRQAALTWLRRP